MKVINRYGPCVGITLFRWNRLNIELWYCPSNYDIVEHSHPSCHIELMFLYGNTEFHRRATKSGHIESASAKFPKNFGKKYTVPAGFYHRFNTGKSPLVFLNIERWLSGVKITSAATDFKVN
jgi:hypothetical protein